MLSLLRKIHMYMEEDVYRSLGRFRNPRDEDVELRLDIVLVAVSSTVFIRLLLAPVLVPYVSFLLLLLGVVAAAWFSGFWAGIAAIVLSAVAETVVHSGGFLAIQSSDYAVTLTLFVLTGFLMSFLIASLARARVRTEEMTAALAAEREKLEESYRRIDAILQSINDGFAVMDDRGRVTYVNRLSGFFLGKSQQELLGRRLSDVLPECRGIFEDEYRRALENGVARHFEIFSAPNNKYFLVYLYPSKAGEAVMYAIDITERKTEEMQKDTFVSVASHELKTPLASARLFAEILERELDSSDPKFAKFAVKMHRQLDRLTALVGELLDVSALRHGKLHFEGKKMDLSSVVSEVAQEAALVLKTHTIETAIENDIWIQGDDVRIRQVLRNLITNAVNYSPQATRVLVTLRKESDNALLSVEDFGVGIPRGHEERIFEPFFQSGNVRHEHSNLGLGLYIVREIVNMHKGKIWVESTVGSGSTFNVKLPTTVP